MSPILTLLSIALPDTCPSCGAPAGVDPRTLLCPDCDLEVPRLPRAIPAPPPLAGAWALGAYQGPLGALVRRGKYRPDPAAMRDLGRRLSDAAPGRLPHADAVTHVPVPLRRRLRRGFDQGELLARAVARALAVPYEPTLTRVRADEQAARAERDRAAGARGAFRLGTRRTRPLPAHLLLIDDVSTTGASAAACADELLAGGARSVTLLCAASRSA